jgi:hypothetical protein
MIGLTGFIDPHVHAAPEHIPRLLNDIALARQARDAGMAGLLIKSHTSLTADRAVIAQQVVQGIRIWGGLVLNYCVGGFNPAAVEVALQYGAAEIWMPTIDAENHRRNVAGGGKGLALQSEEFPDGLNDILNLIAKHDVILGTGHLSVAETSTLARLACRHGVKKILITHPEAPFIDMSVSVQRDLAKLGCMFERTWVFTTPALGSVITPDRLMRDIKEVGFESTVLATDMGQVGNPPPVEGFRAFAAACLDASFHESQIRLMAAENIAAWLKE